MVAQEAGISPTADAGWTICLTAAAFARFPFITIEQLRFYGGVDFLLLLCVTRDWLATGRIHAAYALSLPPIVLGQVIAMTLFLARPAAWIDIAGRLDSLTPK